MPFLPVKPFVPVVSRVPNLGPSSGNPDALRDPNSPASIGLKLQAMTDQVKADTLYDTKTEGFRGGSRSRRVGSLGTSSHSSEFVLVTAIAMLGFALILQSHF